MLWGKPGNRTRNHISKKALKLTLIIVFGWNVYFFMASMSVRKNKDRIEQGRSKQKASGSGEGEIL